jgi:hypothetical protein
LTFLDVRRDKARREKLLAQAEKSRDLLSFRARVGEPTPWYYYCPACDRLKSEYQRAILEIHSVVRTRFVTLREKVRELHKWQDIRDAAVKAFYEHKASHTRRAA